jgi:carbon storage regulator
MLVLSRQRDETIMIGDDIEITVVDIRGDKVRLGITAPSKVAVHRKEVYEAIKRENEQASRVGGDLAMFRPTMKGVPSLARTRTSQLTSGVPSGGGASIINPNSAISGAGAGGASAAASSIPPPAPIPISPPRAMPATPIPKRAQDAG